MWYAGIDWAHDHHDVVIIDEQGHRVAACHVTHSAEGLTELVDFLQQTIAAAPTPQELACLLETPHGLLMTALVEAGLAVYPVNPKTVERRRKPSGAKTDAIDAYLLAKTGRSDLPELRRLLPDSPVLHELKALCRDQEALVANQTRLVNQLTACLKAYYPVALELFSKLHQALTIAFLQTYPTLEAVRGASQEELAALLRRQRHPTPSATAETIWRKVHAPQLQADVVTTRTKARFLLALLCQFAPLLEQIHAYDEDIARLFAQHPDSALFRSLPRAGKRLAPRLLAGWGMTASAMRVRRACRRWPVPPRSPMKAANMPVRIGDRHVSNRCAMRYISLPGNLRRLSRGRRPIIGASVVRGSLTAWQYVR
jgi:transposase